MSDREKLKERIDALSPSAVRFVARMVDSLSSPPTATIGREATWLTGRPDWIEYFGLSLSVHHGTTVEPLGLTGFEIVSGFMRSRRLDCRETGIGDTPICRSCGPGQRWPGAKTVPQIDCRPATVKEDRPHLEVDRSGMDTGHADRKRPARAHPESVPKLYGRCRFHRDASSVPQPERNARQLPVDRNSGRYLRFTPEGTGRRLRLRRPYHRLSLRRTRGCRPSVPRPIRREDHRQADPSCGLHRSRRMGTRPVTLPAIEDKVNCMCSCEGRQRYMMTTGRRFTAFDARNYAEALRGDFILPIITTSC